MSATEPSTEKAAAPRDDEQAATNAHLDLERAVLPTIVSRRVAWILIVAFCALLSVVPAVQIYLEATGRHHAQLADVFYRLALALNADHKPADALRAAENALKLAPNDAPTLDLSRRLRR